jgi:hypothetical protein
VICLKTCSSYRTILIPLSIERSEGCVFILGATKRLRETAKYEPTKYKEWVQIKSFRSYGICSCAFWYTVTHILEGLAAQPSETQFIVPWGNTPFTISLFGRFGGIFCLHLQGFWIWFMWLYDVITQKTLVFSIARRQSLESYFVNCTVG